MWATEEIVPMPETGKPDDDAPVENGVFVAPSGLDTPSSSAASTEKIALDDVGSGPAPTTATQLDEVALPFDSGVSATVPPAAVSTPALSVPSEPSFSDSVSSSQIDLSVSSAPVSVPNTFSLLYAPHRDLSAHSEEQSADHSGLPDAQVMDSPPHTGGAVKSLEAVSAEPTLLDVGAVEAAPPSDDGGATIINGHVDDQETQTQVDEIHATQLEFTENPTSPPSSNTLLSTSSTSTFGESPPVALTLPDVKAGRTPSANRLSISYAGGNRRMVIDSEVVDFLKVFRHEGRIEVIMSINKEGDDGLKGILVCSFFSVPHCRINFVCVAGRSF